MHFHAPFLVACLAAGACSTAWAQVTLKPDGQWRSLFTAGANATSGNSNTTQLNAVGEGARVTERDKLTVRGQANYGQVNGATATQRYLLGSQYNRDISRHSFYFGSADLLRDRPANIDLRYSLATGVGRHMRLDDIDNTFDISLGLGYTQDRYMRTVQLLGQTRTDYGRTELVMSEESNHKISDTTKLRQRVALFPNLTDRGAYRALLDTGVSVAMTKSLSLTAGLSYRYDSDPGIGLPGVGLKKGDAAFVTGVSLRFD